MSNTALQKTIERNRELENLILNGGNTDESTPSGESSSSSDTAPRPKESNFEQQYKVLEGKYRAEVPRLHETIAEYQKRERQMTNELSQLKAQVTQLTQQLENAKKATSPEESPIDRLRNDYGDPLVDTLKAELASLRAQLDSQQKPVEQPNQAPVPQQPVKDPIAENRLEYIYTALGGEAEFKRIDNDPEFNKWLDEPDPLYGIERRQVLQQFFSNGKLNETLQFYLTWKSSHPGAPAKPNALDEHVMPGQINTGTEVNANSGKKIYTRAEIAQAYSDFIRKPYYKTPQGIKEKQAFEQDLDLAMREGRVSD